MIGNENESEEIKQDTNEGVETNPIASSTEGVSAESDTSNEQQEESSEENDFAKDVVKDSEGKEFIPKEVLLKRLGSLTAKRKEAEELLEAIRTNPEVRAQFLKEAESEKTTESSKQEAPEAEAKTPEWTNLTGWFNKLSSNPEHQSFYREYTTALINDLNPMLEHVISTRLEKAIAPFKKYVGETTLKTFSDKNKDFSKYEQAVYKKMKDTGMSHEDAYKAVKYDDLLKENSALKSGAKTNSPTEKNRQKLNQTPITKRAPISVSKTKPGNLSLDEAIGDSMKELGWGKK